MREWQIGDPAGDGNDIGIPDIPYMDYLKTTQIMNHPVPSVILRNINKELGMHMKTTDLRMH